MRRDPLLILLVVLIALPGPLRADDTPRTVIERAVKAQGIPMGPDDPQGSFTKIKGRVHVADGATFTAEGFQQEPRRFKLVLDLDIEGSRATLIEVRNGSKAWVHINEQTTELGEKRLGALDRSSYVDHVAGLAPLLKEPGYTLTALGESKLEERTVVGILVASKGRPDVRLYFDKASGLLVKSAYRDHDPDEDHLVLQETLYYDYRKPDFAAADEAVLRAAGLATDGPALLEMFRRQTLTRADRERMKTLARQLGDRSFRKRQEAAEALVRYGAVAVPLLREAARSEDPEIARRAAACLRQIGRIGGDGVLAAAARLLAQRRPEGTAEILLAYLPDAAGPAAAHEVQVALAAIAQSGGKPHPVLVRALDDSDPVRRAAAAAALGRDGGAFARRPGRRVYLTELRQPGRVVCLRDGKKLEWEVIDFQLFNRLDDGIFVKP
jgi:hypothetical protein